MADLLDKSMGFWEFKLGNRKKEKEEEEEEEEEETEAFLKEVFKSPVEGKVGMYVCGITAYDYNHIGLARAFIFSDVLWKMQIEQQLSVLQSLVDFEKEVRTVLGVLGLLSSKSYSDVLLQLKDKALIRAALTEEDVLRAVKERLEARKNNDLSRSDQIRTPMAVKGIALMDVRKEVVWRPSVPIP